METIRGPTTRQSLYKSLFRTQQQQLLYANVQNVVVPTQFSDPITNALFYIIHTPFLHKLTFKKRGFDTRLA